MGKKKYNFFELVEGEKKEKKKQELAEDPHKLAKEFYQNRKEQYRVYLQKPWSDHLTPDERFFNYG